MNTNLVTRISAVLLVGVALASVGCKHKQAEGPMERAGKSVDNAAEKTKDTAVDVKNDVKKDLKKD